MAASFPISIVTHSDLICGDARLPKDQVNDVFDEVIAIEAALGIPGSAVASSLDYVVKNTVGGHRHSGADSRKVLATNLDVASLTSNQLLRVSSGGTAVESSGKIAPVGVIIGDTDTQTLTSKTLTQPTVTLKQSTTPTPTAEGDIQWNTNDNALMVGDGVNTLRTDFGVWRTWVPTFTNLSGGTLNSARYAQHGRTVHIMITYTLGGAGVSGSVSFTPPINLNSNWASVVGFAPIGHVGIEDFGTTTYLGVVGVLSVSSLRLYVLNSASTYTTENQLSATVPMTFATSDKLFITGTYEI